MENIETKQERTKAILVYAGMEGKDLYRYYELIEVNGINKVFNFGLYSKSLFKSKIIGACFDVEKSDKSTFYNEKSSPKFLDFENKVEIISNWKLTNDLVNKKLKEKLDTQTINKFETLKNFRTYFRTLESIERQVVLIDLIKYLNQ